MSDIKIDETCSCGAEFHWIGHTAYAKEAVRDWRQEHRHDLHLLELPR